MSLVNHINDGSVIGTEAQESLKETYKGLFKFNSAVGAVFKMAEATQIELKSPLDKIQPLTTVVKVVHGALCIREFFTNVAKTLASTTVLEVCKESIKTLESAGEIANGADNAVTILRRYKIIAEIALWSTIHDAAQVALSIISLIKTTFHTLTLACFLHTFRRDIKSIKVLSSNSSERTTKICELVKYRLESLREKAVVNNQGMQALDVRLIDICRRIQENERIEVLEIKHLVRCIKDRLREHIGLSMLETALACTRVVLGLMRIACKEVPGSPFITGITSPISFAAYIYKIQIPKGDIEATEKPMVYASACRKVNSWIRGC